MGRIATGSIQIDFDALDECQTRTQLLLWIQRLVKAQDNGEIQLWVSSRKGEDIERALYSCISDNDSISIQGKAVDADIKAYIQGILRSGKKFQRWSSRPEVLDEIETELMKKAGGM